MIISIYSVIVRFLPYDDGLHLWNLGLSLRLEDKANKGGIPIEKEKSWQF